MWFTTKHKQIYDQTIDLSICKEQTEVLDMAAFTNGPTGPGPRGPLIFFNLGGPEQSFKNLWSAIECNLVFDLTSAENTMILVLTIPEVEINYLSSQT